MVMQFALANTFESSLIRLPNAEQSQVKSALVDLFRDPTAPGLQMHRVDKNKHDPDFWSVKVGRGPRIIVHWTADLITICYAGRHDDAYSWVERRRIAPHPMTGALQMFVVQEIVEERQIWVDAPARPLANRTDEELDRCGVPEFLRVDVRAATEHSLLSLTDRLPEECVEALIDLIAGRLPLPSSSRSITQPIDHPDARRRFRLIETEQELQDALGSTWERWAVFLHPHQREAVEKDDWNGPVRISGSAGTGKTIVAVHRAVHLAKMNPDERVLLTTFSTMLARSLNEKIRVLVARDPRIRERIEIETLDDVAQRLYRTWIADLTLATNEDIRAVVEALPGTALSSFHPSFLETEWTEVADAWGVETFDEYKSVERLGRRQSLTPLQRKAVWEVIEHIPEALRLLGRISSGAMYKQLADHVKLKGNRPFAFVVVDEAQDVSVAQLRLLSEFGANQVNGLFFTGDLAQRIFRAPFSWAKLGVNIRGRSRTLRINYRTSKLIRESADNLIDREIADPDGISERRDNLISLFAGVPPEIKRLATREQERDSVANWVRARLDSGSKPDEIAIFVRSPKELDRAYDVAATCGLSRVVLDDGSLPSPGSVTIGTMHFAKGLEFRSVAVMACDRDVIPSQGRSEDAISEHELQRIETTERHLLYVACTRARDHLHLSGVRPVSQFFDDLEPSLQRSSGNLQ